MARLNRKFRLKRLFSTPLRTTGILCVILIIVAGVYWYYNRPFSKRTAVIPSTNVTSSAKKSTPQQSNPTNSGVNNTSPAKSTANASPVGSNAPLIAPWGNFVSNHHPGNGAPTTETSVCNTTPGATCYIRFTNGSLNRSLDSKVADANGSIIWSWDVSSAGFSSGSWQITAIASLNGQTQSTTDAQELVIP